MKFKSTIFAQTSGSLAGTTFSHNRGGLYTRSRSIPVNPNTTFQQAVRTTFGLLSNIWLNILTLAQRDAWDNYASLVLIPDSLGEPRNVGGIGMFQRTNTPRLQAGLARIDDAPSVFNLGDYTAPTIVSITAPTAISLAFTAADAWANATGAAMVVLASRGQNASRNFFKGPYRFAGSILGDTTTPPTSPAAITSPFPLSADQRQFIQVRVLQEDGRTSTPFRDFAVVA
jgi:hypothetical protein